MTGKIRVLPFDTAGLPPSVPFDPVDKYDDTTTCMAVIWAVDEPVIMDLMHDLREGVYCTRPKGHPEDEVHTCHLRDEVTDAPLCAVVWGGE